MSRVFLSDTLDLAISREGRCGGSVQVSGERGIDWRGDGVLVGCEGGGLMDCKVVGLAGVQAV